jgi:hypothetical protein
MHPLEASPYYQRYAGSGDPIPGVMGREIDRVENGRFAPGQSANPGGRPATVREVVELAREHAKTAYAQRRSYPHTDQA